MENSLLHLNETLSDGLHYIVDISTINDKTYSKYSIYCFTNPIDTQGFSVLKEFKEDTPKISLELDKYQKGTPRNFFDITSKSMFYPAFQNMLQNGIYRLGSLKQEGIVTLSELDKKIRITFEDFKEEDRFLLEVAPYDMDLFAKRSYAALDNLVYDFNLATSAELAKPIRLKQHK